VGKEPLFVLPEALSHEIFVLWL